LAQLTVTHTIRVRPDDSLQAAHRQPHPDRGI